MKNITLIDCYTDEPAGLGVPPFLGTYPRYIAGYFFSKGYNVNYVTIDDVRSLFFPEKKGKKYQKTNIRQYNTTKNQKEIKKLLEDKKVIILGVNTPGKYLSAVPGTLRELQLMKISGTFTGPAMFTQLEGGKHAQKIDNFKDFLFSYDDISKYAISGVKIIRQIDDLRVIEIEAGHGCSMGKCSFCTEPQKSDKVSFRKNSDILKEIMEFYRLGVRHFRIGKQSDFYRIPNVTNLLRDIRKKMPDIETLHIDNVNPNSVVNDKNNEITKAIVKYCSPGNIAAFGVESFDKEVIKKNKLNSSIETTHKAIKILNEFGQEKGKNGMPKFLPGLNFILGLEGETKKTLSENFDNLKKILDSGLMLRRINIRQVAIFPGTQMEKVGTKYLKKNKRYYWSFRDNVRKKIDLEMLKRIMPKETILKDIRIEIADGKTFFGRQIGTYPIIVGIRNNKQNDKKNKQDLEIGKFYDIKISDHMLRSVVGELVEK